MSDLLDIQQDAAGVVRVTLTRPPVNALSVALMTELEEVARALESDRGVRVAVLLSSVPGVFMAGADLSDVLSRLDDVAGLNRLLRSALDRWERLPFPTIASIDGHALGGGCELALACDFRIMSRGRPRIGLPEVKRGLLAAGGGTQRVLRVVGRARALDLVMRGRLLAAEEAEHIGLITQAVESSERAAATQSFIEELLELPAMAVAAAKRVVLDGDDVPLAAGLTLEGEAMQDLVSGSADSREGITAFLEKRTPVFTGR